MITNINIRDLKGATKEIKEVFSALIEAEMQDNRAKFEEERRVWIWDNLSEYSKTGEYPYPLHSFEAYIQHTKPIHSNRPKTRKQFYEEFYEVCRIQNTRRPSYFKFDKERQ